MKILQVPVDPLQAFSSPIMLHGLLISAGISGPHYCSSMVASSQRDNVLNVVQKLSNLLNTGLSREELDIVLKLVQEGENPEVITGI